MSREIIVASDTHGASRYLHELEQAYPHADLFLHCGDLEDYPDNYPAWIFVRGNNDFLPSMPDSRVVKVGGVSVYMTHSHRLSYHHRLQQLAAAAKENGCRIALYGHTHRPSIEEVNGVICINPGSMLLPRDGRSPSYARIVIDDDGKIQARILRQEDWPFAWRRKLWFDQ